MLRTVLFLLLLPASALSADFSALTRPGAVAIMRHALAPGGGDPARFRLGDCATQRNLDAAGRDQARAIGAAIRSAIGAADVSVDRVLTSQWCRCRETGRLLDLGPVEDLPALDSFFADRARGPAQTEALRAFLAARPEGERLMLVTHQVNITALTGVFPRSGEVVVIDVAPDGTVTVLDRVAMAP